MTIKTFKKLKRQIESANELPPVGQVKPKKKKNLNISVDHTRPEELVEPLVALVLPPTKKLKIKPKAMTRDNSRSDLDISSSNIYDKGYVPDNASLPPLTLRPKKYQ